MKTVTVWLAIALLPATAALALAGMVFQELSLSIASGAVAVPDYVSTLQDVPFFLSMLVFGFLHVLAVGLVAGKPSRLVLALALYGLANMLPSYGGLTALVVSAARRIGTAVGYEQPQPDEMEPATLLPDILVALPVSAVAGLAWGAVLLAAVRIATPDLARPRAYLAGGAAAGLSMCIAAYLDIHGEYYREPLWVLYVIVAVFALLLCSTLPVGIRAASAATSAMPPLSRGGRAALMAVLGLVLAIGLAITFAAATAPGSILLAAERLLYGHSDTLRAIGAFLRMYRPVY